MKRSTMIFALGALLAANPVLADEDGPGEVTGLSVLPGSGNATVVIDVTGSVTVQDFTLSNPYRIVVDVVGARHTIRNTRYDGVVRAGITNIRYSQRRPDVVRVVLELDASRSYELEYSGDEIRLRLGTDQTFAAWTTERPITMARAHSTDAVPTTPPVTTVPDYLQEAARQSQAARITVTWDSASIADVMSGFSSFTGKSIVLGEAVEGSITAQIVNQPWDIAFQTILDANGLTAVEIVDGIIRVDSRTALAARDSTEPTQSRLIQVNFARASSMQPAIANVLTDRGQVVADTSSNTLIVTDVENRLDVAEDLVEQLDRPTPQVSIQAKIIFVNRTDIEDLGVQYDLGTTDAFFNQLIQRPDPATAEPVDTDGDGVPDASQATEFFNEDQTVVTLGGNALAAVANASDNLAKSALDLIFSTAIGNFDLTTFVSALQQVDLADLQAEPLVTTSDNTLANVLSGERTPIRVIDAGAQQGGENTQPVASTQLIETGIRLDVTPHVTNTRQILLDIHAENSSLQAAPSDLGFTFQTQEATSEVLVNDGQTAVIGGLTVTQVTVSKSGIPYLVDLPIVGRLFGFSTRREERRDLLILVTPHIIDDLSQDF